ncbi:LuxR family two component transcriptional regulator [Saccharopolyspora erythraea NRRL 2338]|uniref:Two-component system response regulator n=2 Tax=Saccharopolyspora erythraea TaxID=1836 RepID=A4FQT2_SACEN|nr:response regulator transcription factor [Saccharopolyspora erythraea]EQD87652.1 LuxR family transcriptional regulator [Saccharopolyspora erythraea D]PFG93009.1 LuxR family two component transcriptional regulator [Saccharopolyspora erythraea NRRL 2338]QRK89897.1 response regulator transcription factor [Saccharopolyspora erythraea]CAM06407.1 two-component system response regulator [Saccharopolyspora erythraea NRRL 2338]
MIRVLIADDQEMVRAGFRMILESQGTIEVVGDVANGVDAVRVAREKRPDVCLMDIRMPGIDGLEATKRLAGPGVTDPVKVVVVTTFDLDEYVDAALANGASGFLLKDAGPALLIEAIQAAVRGDALVSPQITVRLLKHFSQSRERVRSAVAPPKEELTERELQVVRATAKGLTNTEIGRELFMSLSTVKTHLAAAQAKIGARNRVETAAWAWRSGLMEDL